MRAVLCTKWGGPEDLGFGNVAPPALTENGVRIRVHAAGVNFADTLAIQGKYQERGVHPFPPGLEAAGEVVDVGARVTKFKPGDRVMANGSTGAWAEQAVYPDNQVWKIPESMDWVQAASFSVVYGTSHLGITDRGQLKPGEVLLVHGAAGGVGLTAVEIGKILGATVIATAGTDEKCALTKTYGADHAINYTTEDIRERVKALTGDKGADVIYDPVGGDVFDASLRCINWGGRIVTLGFAQGRIPQAPCNILLVKHISVLGHYVGSYRTHAPHLMDAAYAECFKWFEEGKIKPHISHVLPFEEAPKALELLITRKSTGKVVLTVG